MLGFKLFLSIIFLTNEVSAKRKPEVGNHMDAWKDFESSNASIMLTQKFSRLSLTQYLDKKPPLWESQNLTETQRQYYLSLIGVASPTNEHLEEIKFEQMRLESTFNHRQQKNPQRRYSKLPRRFDAREKWPQCAEIFNVITDQGRCSSCWAVASASAMSDRVCVGSNGQRRVQISANDLMSCCAECQVQKGDGCKTGYTFTAWRYWINKGIVSGSTYDEQRGCQPYPIPGGGFETRSGGQCERSCKNGQQYSRDKYYGASVSFPKSMVEIQHALYNHGPLVVHMDLYSDLMEYRSGVYYHRYGNKLGLHLLKLIGWGEEDGTPYWLATNSWGTWFGNQGFIKVVRGTNHLGIERLGVSGIYDHRRSSFSSH